MLCPILIYECLLFVHFVEFFETAEISMNSFVLGIELVTLKKWKIKPNIWPLKWEIYVPMFQKFENAKEFRFMSNFKMLDASKRRSKKRVFVEINDSKHKSYHFDSHLKSNYKMSIYFPFVKYRLRNFVLIINYVKRYFVQIVPIWLKLFLDF